MTGICTECTAADLVLDEQTCSCSDDLFDNGSTCDAYVTCEDGQYVDQAANECASCAEGCAVCTDGTGACTSCTDPTFTVNSLGECTDPSTEPASCTNYGPENAPTGCYEGRYSDDRLLPPFADDAVSVDWRDWGVVKTPGSQGECGACGFFAAVGTAESVYAVKYGTLYDASEQ